MRAIVIGGAGFIGSHLVDLLVQRGTVTVYDNLSVGKQDFIRAHLDSKKVTLIQKDALDLGALTDAVKGHDVCFHLAANPEARWGLERTRLDLEQGTIATYNALEACRLTGVKRFVFSSSGTVYGNNPEPCGEMDLGHLPFSLYGASKIAGESLVASYVECFGLHGAIVRFGNVVGARGTHGAILDFSKKLKSHPEYLDVLGDGTQSKPYLHVTDCAAGLHFIWENAKEPLGVYNLGPDTWTSVKKIAELVVKHSPHPNARIEYGTKPQGWPGDVPTSRLKIDKLAKLGFKVRYTSDAAVELAVQEIVREVFGS